MRFSVLALETLIAVRCLCVAICRSEPERESANHSAFCATSQFALSLQDWLHSWKSVVWILLQQGYLYDSFSCCICMSAALQPCTALDRGLGRTADGTCHFAWQRLAMLDTVLAELLQDLQLVEEWVSLTRTALKGLRHRPRKLLVIINPYGGARKARRVWTRIAQPVLHLTGGCYLTGCGICFALHCLALPMCVNSSCCRVLHLGRRWFPRC